MNLVSQVETIQCFLKENSIWMSFLIGRDVYVTIYDHLARGGYIPLLVICYVCAENYNASIWWPIDDTQINQDILKVK